MGIFLGQAVVHCHQTAGLTAHQPLGQTGQLVQGTQPVGGVGPLVHHIPGGDGQRQPQLARVGLELLLVDRAAGHQLRPGGSGEPGQDGQTCHHPCRIAVQQDGFHAVSIGIVQSAHDCSMDRGLGAEQGLQRSSIHFLQLNQGVGIVLQHTHRDTSLKGAWAAWPS